MTTHNLFSEEKILTWRELMKEKSTTSLLKKYILCNKNHEPNYIPNNSHNSIKELNEIKKINKVMILVPYKNQDVSHLIRLLISQSSISFCVHKDPNTHVQVIYNIEEKGNSISTMYTNRNKLIREEKQS